MKKVARFLKKYSLGVALFPGFLAILNIIYNHGLDHLDWRARDEDSRYELRLLAKIIRKGRIFEGPDWVGNLLLEYENSRDLALRDYKYIKENYIFFEGAFIDRELPLIFPKERGRGGFVVHPSGFVGWCRARDLADIHSDDRVQSVHNRVQANQ